MSAEVLVTGKTASINGPVNKMGPLRASAERILGPAGIDYKVEMLRVFPRGDQGAGAAVLLARCGTSTQACVEGLLRQVGEAAGL